MNVDVIDVNGKVAKQIELNDEIFNIKPNRSAMYEAIKNELANKRQGTSSTKTKSEVRGSGKKPWKQKGTGRSRVGTKQNPVWKGGGVAFGPKPRDFSYKIPKKVKRLAYKSVLSMKLGLGDLKVIEDFQLKENKTKELNSILKPILNEDKSVLILDVDDNNKMIKRAGNNLPYLKCLDYNRMKMHSLYYSNKILISEKAVNNLNDFFNKANKE